MHIEHFGLRACQQNWKGQANVIALMVTLKDFQSKGWRERKKMLPFGITGLEQLSLSDKLIFLPLVPIVLMQAVCELPHATLWSSV